MWCLLSIVLSCGSVWAQNPIVNQPPGPLSPLPAALPMPSPVPGNPFTPLTPILPPPMSGPGDAPGTPPGQLMGTPALEPGAAPAMENLVGFDTLRVTLSWANNRWQLKAGDVVLKDFGRRELEAHQALRLIRELRLTQRGTVGSPNPVMEYWLCDGRAPQGLTSGLHTLALEPTSLRVVQEQGQWVLRDGRRVLFNFGRSEAEARQAQAVIQKYGFSQVGIVGQAVPTMMVFLSQPSDRLGAPAVASPPAFTPQGRQPHNSSSSPAQPAPDALAKLPGGIHAVVPPAVLPLREPAQPAQGPHQPFSKTATPDHQPTQLLPGFGDLSARVPFDWRQVKLVQEGVNWRMKVNGLQLADFGSDRVSAERALAAVNYYRFNEQCLIGSPQPCFSYFLVNGKAPQGTLLGTQTHSFQPETLQVKQVGQRWAVVARDQPLVQLRDKPEEAKQLLEAIQRNRFDRLCRVGPNEEHSLTYFVRSR